jgi:hypothetical protein
MFHAAARRRSNKRMNPTRRKRASYHQSLVLAGYPRRYAAALRLGYVNQCRVAPLLEIRIGAVLFSIQRCGITSHWSGRAIRESFIISGSCAPLNSSVRPLPSDGNDGSLTRAAVWESKYSGSVLQHRRPNKRMNPTRGQQVSHDCCARSRVIRGVGRFENFLQSIDKGNIEDSGGKCPWGRTKLDVKLS